MVQRLNWYIDWQWAYNYWRLHQADVCPGFCTVLTLANAEGYCIAVDFFRLGGCPWPILELLNETVVAKVFFNLRAD